MMNSAIVIALTIACSNGVWANTIPTTVPPTTVPDTTVPTTTPHTSPPPQVCNVNGIITLDVGQTIEDKQPWDGICQVFVCDSPPDAYSHFACYDSTTDECVPFYSTQMIDGCERVCEPWNPNTGRPGWVDQGCGDTPTTLWGCPSATEGPLPECTWNGVQYTYGEIPNSGGCICDYTGDVMCPPQMQ